MKRIAVMACTVVALLVGTNTSHASWGAACYSGYQPWWNIFAKRYKCLTPEEERLQKFWHDYYHALQEFYCSLDHIDWVAYYKNHGIPVGGGCGPYGPNCGRINYYPVFVSPTMQWAMPNGPGCGPGGPGAGFGPGPMSMGPVSVPPGAPTSPGPTPSGHALGGYPGAAQGGIPVSLPMGPGGMPPMPMGAPIAGNPGLR
jgi:hypothetical protein